VRSFLYIADFRVALFSTWVLCTNEGIDILLKILEVIGKSDVHRQSWTNGLSDVTDELSQLACRLEIQRKPEMLEFVSEAESYPIQVSIYTESIEEHPWL